MRIITYNKENECEKQDGVSPDSILYAGPIEGITDAQLVDWGIGYNDIAYMLKEANGTEDEDFMLLINE